MLLECFALFWHFLLSVSFFHMLPWGSGKKWVYLSNRWFKEYSIVGTSNVQIIQIIPKYWILSVKKFKKSILKNMDYNCNAVYGVCAILTFLGLFIFLFTYFLCQFRSIGYTAQPDNLNNTQVLIHQCEEGSGKCYLVDQNVIKISCPTLIGKEVNKIFH
jgi:hypothetical protein